MADHPEQPPVRLVLVPGLGLDERSSVQVQVQVQVRVRARVPATVVRGTRDRLCPHDWAATVAAAAPNGRLVELPGAAHM
jgi:pimeloyl-ACP methyl ester carboxylesterase